MLKINANSWHFRVWKYMFRHKKEENLRIEADYLNLCKYFWTVVYYITIGFLIDKTLTVLKYIVFYASGFEKDYGDGMFTHFEFVRPWQPIPVVILLWLSGLFAWKLPFLSFEFAEALLIITTTLTIVASIIALFLALHEYYTCHIKYTSFDGVAKEFLKAKKSKMCPKIEVDW